MTQCSRILRWALTGALIFLLGCGGDDTVPDASPDAPAPDAPAPDATADATADAAPDALPDAEPMCVEDGNSCAMGETCCDGLQCCTGVPVPAGEEYCAMMCPQSDREAKRNFRPVDAEEVLERVLSLPISTWSYRNEDDTVRHIGPMAQDFRATFEVGPSDRHIATVDADGVALAAIQALHAELEELRRENARLWRAVGVEGDAVNVGAQCVE